VHHKHKDVDSMCEYIAGCSTLFTTTGP